MSNIEAGTIVKKTPLISTHLEMGAEVGTYFGWQMPASYEPIGKEVWKVRNGVGVVDLSYHGIVRIGGTEGSQFLQGLVTNDVKGLLSGQGIPAAFLTGHGKVRAFCLILKIGDEYLIVNDPQTHEKIYQQVFPFTYAGDFLVADVSENYRVLSLQGPNSLLVLREVSFEPIPELDENSWVETIVAGHKVMVSRHSRTGLLGFDLYIPENSLKDVWDFLMLKGMFHSIIPFGMDALNVLRIEAGIPVYGIDIDESNMMLESGLDSAVSFTKGCYTGQEAVAMATYRGHVSKKLAGMVFNEGTDVKPGDKIVQASKEVGKISSLTYSETLKKNIGLGCIKYGFFTPGERLDIVTGNKVVEAVVVQLPFVE
jgi:folate-binding protein YgfZ